MDKLKPYAQGDDLLNKENYKKISFKGKDFF